MATAVREEVARRLIVSRHPATIAFLRAECPELANVDVIIVATPEMVKGAVVYGNLPMHLAALAKAVVAVEFSGPPPRGAEYGLEEMRAAGAQLRTYFVRSMVAELPCLWPGTRAEGKRVAPGVAELTYFDPEAGRYDSLLLPEKGF